MREKMNNLTLLSSVFLMLSFTSVKLEAAGCIMMQYLDNKSQGVELFKNSCQQNAQVAIGARFELTPGARLWLKSSLQSESKKYFQMICQNQANHPVTLKVSSMFLPWITADNLKNCGPWNNTKLSCADNNGNKHGFVCVTAPIKNPDFSKFKQPERTTSVNMRNVYIDKTGYAYFKDVIDFLKPEIKLCQQLHPSDFQIEVQWNVNGYGAMANIYVIPTGAKLKLQLSECVQAVVDQFDYPLLNGNASFSHKF